MSALRNDGKRDQSARSVSNEGSNGQAGAGCAWPPDGESEEGGSRCRASRQRAERKAGQPGKGATKRRRARSDKERVGRVTVHARGAVWYIYYLERGQRIRKRVGPVRDEALQLAAQINAQLATGAPAMLSFEPVSLPVLRQRWLDHHEHVLRSSVNTVARYRSATTHLMEFSGKAFNGRAADKLTLTEAEAFVRYLREARVAPNGHPKAKKVRLRDKGILFILETCRAMFNYAARHRHLPPYHENPFGQLQFHRLRVEDAKPIDLLRADQEERFFAACDEWQLPIFLTFALTGLRPGELAHLFLPDDVDLEHGLLHVRNKADLGWRTKTRNERTIPMVEELRAVMAALAGGRRTGPLFLRRRFVLQEDVPLLADCDRRRLAAELERRCEQGRQAAEADGAWSRADEATVTRRLWQDAGAIKTDRLRMEFIKIARRAGMPEATCPKVWRHMFATTLQDANVDPLIRQELMGHASGSRANDRRGANLGTTSLYTHTRDETRRAQLEAALRLRSVARHAASRWLRCTAANNCKSAGADA